MTWQDGLLFFAVIVVGSFVGAIDAWLEQRKWEKGNWREKR